MKDVCVCVCVFLNVCLTVRAYVCGGHSGFLLTAAGCRQIYPRADAAEGHNSSLKFMLYHLAASIYRQGLYNVNR